jgi:6-pyruvoyl-tetrahydropterin synthase
MQLFVNDLTVIDFSYLSLQRGVVGESWIVDVLLTGELNDQSMVLDFGIVKKQIKQIIDDAVDHKLLLPGESPQLTVSDSQRAGHWFVDFWRARDQKGGSIHLQSPEQAFALIPTAKITEDSVTRYLEVVIKQQLPKNVQGLKITLRAEEIHGNYYHYSHGLKKHDGNCQRIAHGHRSKILLSRNGEQDVKLEQKWAQRFDDIYLATIEDQISHEQVELSDKAMAELAPDHQFFSYYAPQGRFDIALTPEKVEIVDCDSTVELLADYIARQLKAESPHDSFRVTAFEGVGKGAIANA